MAWAVSAIANLGNLLKFVEGRNLNQEKITTRVG